MSENFLLAEPDPDEVRASPKRPFGVYVLVALQVLGIVAAALEITRARWELVGFWAEAEQFLLARSMPLSLAARLTDNPTHSIIISSVMIAIWLLIIIGLWLLQRWAWLSLMIITGLGLVVTLVLYFSGEPDFIGMLMRVAVVFYLNDHHVQRVFARRARREEAAA